MNDKIETLLNNNNIPYDLFLFETYNCFLVSMLQVIVDECEEDREKKLELRNRLRESNNNSITIKKIVYEKFKCLITDEESGTISKWVIAYLNKKDKRIQFDDTVRERLLLKQTDRCNICGREIQSYSSEIDHIIPFALVGDELGEENLQLLCIDCNRRKSNDITYNLKMFLINKS